MTVSGVGLGLPTGMAGWKLLQGKQPTDFKIFSKDPVLQRDIAYVREKLPTKATAKEMLADRRLQGIVLQAYGLDAQIGMNALMEKVLNSDPTDTSSVAARMTDSKYLQIAKDLGYGMPQVPAVPATPSAAQVTVTGLNADSRFDRFTGSFAGITVTDLPVAGATSLSQLATTLQAAFRKADGGATDISVKVSGLHLVFSDTKGRGTVGGVSFKANGQAAAVLDPAASVVGSTATTSAAAVPSVAKVTVTSLAGTQGFASFSGKFGGVTLNAVPLGSTTDLNQVAATLQAAFQSKRGDTAITVTVSGDQLVFTDSKGRGTASNVDFAARGGPSAVLDTSRSITGMLAIPAVAAKASTANVAVTGLQTGQTLGLFNGSFGGVKVSNLLLSGASDLGTLASTLQAAFRKADGGRSNISVTATSTGLLFSDAKGRGTASSFSFGSSGAARATLGATTAGSQAVESIGGSNIGKSELMDKLVQLYTQAKFEQTLGDTSETLRQAVYARRMLPNVTNWYSVIGDVNLASVVRTVLGLPDSFAKLDVDQQKAMLTAKMPITDFKDSTKLGKMLDRYVALTSVNDSNAWASGSAVLQIVQPIDLSGGSYGFDGSSSAALFSALTATGSSF